MSYLKFVLLTLIILIISNLAHSTIKSETTLALRVVHVNAEASLGGNGKTWGQAYRYLQDGLNSAATLTGMGHTVEIWVAEGNYYPDEDEAGNVTNDDRNEAFRMLNNTSILGGFKGIENSKSQRNWVAKPTILSGNIQQNNNLQNAFHVIYNNYPIGNSLNNSAVLSGFVIRDGRADFSGSSAENGGGIYNVYSSPIIEYSTFRDNYAVDDGSAMYNINSNPIIRNCILHSNFTISSSNNIYNLNSDLDLVNVTIKSGNNGTDGIIRNTSTSKLAITNSICWGNSTFIVNEATSSSNVNYSIIHGGHSGTGNLNQYPKFTDTLLLDFSLNICSAGINAGNNASSSGSVDHQNMTRIQHGTIDMGAIESSGHRLYVDKDAFGADDGSSWTNAYITLQDALYFLESCNGSPAEIWIAEGTYYPDEGGISINNNRSEYYKMQNYVGIYGGFLGFETSLSQQIPATYQVFLSGDINQNNVLSDNSYHVVRNEYTSGDQLTSSAIIDGIYILLGNANNTSFGTNNSIGGGMLNIYSSPRINECYFNLNEAINGGSIHNISSNPLITNCSFFQNKASKNGGAIFNNASSPNISSCTFIQNESNNSVFSESGGGAIGLALGSSPILTGCTFVSNKARTKAGAVSISGGSIPIFNQCIFSGNESERGGAIYTVSSNNTFNNCQFSTNKSIPRFLTQAFYHGGAIAQISGSSTIDGCTFTSNQCEVQGGAIYIETGNAIITNDTFISNNSTLLNGGSDGFANQRGGAIYVGTDGTASISGSSFSTNFASDEGGAIYTRSTGLTTMDRCTFHDNSADIGGGAIYCTSDSNLIINSLFTKNNTQARGGAIFVYGSNPKIINCTLFKNSSPFNEGDALYCSNNAAPEFVNNISWNFNSEIFNSSSTPVLSNSLIKGGYAGGSSIISSYPEFLDTVNFNLQLKNCSPAIDTGDNLENLTTLDILYGSRIYDAKNDGTATIDLGAYEFQSTYSAACCTDHLSLMGIISSGTYEASISITCNGTITAGSNVIFSAPDSVVMSNNFTVESTGTYEVNNIGCN